MAIMFVVALVVLVLQYTSKIGPHTELSGSAEGFCKLHSSSCSYFVFVVVNRLKFCPDWDEQNQTSGSRMSTKSVRSEARVYF